MKIKKGKIIWILCKQPKLHHGISHGTIWIKKYNMKHHVHTYVNKLKTEIIKSKKKHIIEGKKNIAWILYENTCRRHMQIFL